MPRSYPIFQNLPPTLSMSTPSHKNIVFFLNRTGATDLHFVTLSHHRYVRRLTLFIPFLFTCALRTENNVLNLISLQLNCCIKKNLMKLNCVFVHKWKKKFSVQLFLLSRIIQQNDCMCTINLNKCSILSSITTLRSDQIKLLFEFGCAERFFRGAGFFPTTVRRISQNRVQYNILKCDSNFSRPSCISVNVIL